MTTGTAQDQGPKILVVCWILVIVPGLIVGLRFYCKVMLSRGFGWDDATILVAWTLQLIYTAMITQSVKLGVVGKHVNSIPAREAIPEALKLVYISFVIIIIGCVLSKTSFALTLLRIITKTWMKVLLWYIIISMNAIMWLCAICYLIQCSPTAALWDIRLMKTANCWPTIVFEAIALAAGAYSGLMDVVLALLPWPVIWKLQMRRREKFGIALAMSMGIFASITAFIKTSQLVNVAHLHDFTWFCSSIVIWSSAETGCTIFAASIPALRVIFVRMRSIHERSGDGTNADANRRSPGKIQKFRRPRECTPAQLESSFDSYATRCPGQMTTCSSAWGTTRRDSHGSGGGIGDDLGEVDLGQDGRGIRETKDICITYERNLGQSDRVDRAEWEAGTV